MPTIAPIMRTTATAALLALAVSAAGAHAAPDPGALRTTATVAVQPAVLDALRTTGRADVIVRLRDDALASDALEVLAAKADTAQQSVLDRLQGKGFVLSTRYDVLPLLAGAVDAEGLQALLEHPVVLGIEADIVLRPVGAFAPAKRLHPERRLAEAVPAIGVDYVHDVLGIRGKGITVAVLDTGIDNTHQDFAGRIVEQYCYSSSRSCAPNNIVESPNAQDEAGHGTAVSGIVLSAGTVSDVGVAPEANLVAVRVFRDEGGAQTSDIIKGLDFVLRKAAPLGIRVVNMSLGGGAGRGVNCDDQNRAMKEAFQRLVNRQVAIFVATGNDGFPSEVSSPACISNSIAVGATYDDQYASGGGFCPRQRDVTPLTIACFTNRGRAMDILAPGLLISSSALGGGVTKPGAGTSYASPMAAGVAALLFQADPDLRPAEVERQLKVTGRTVQHLENSDTFPLVDARAAVLSVLGGVPPTPPQSPVPSPTATTTRTATTTVPSPTAGASATASQVEPTAGSETATPTATRTPTPSSTAGTTGAREAYLPVLRNRAAR